MSGFVRQRELLQSVMPQQVSGRVVQLTGLAVAVSDFPVPVGASCRIVRRHGPPAEAEVVGFRGELAVLMPLDELAGISPGDEVICRNVAQRVPVGERMLGRVINAYGQPIDHAGPLLPSETYPLNAAPIGALKRSRIEEPLGTGIRAIDALLTCGRGQRMGIFSGPGVGKSVLLGMIARGTDADVTVIALVGERGREVRDFIEKDLGPDGLKKSVLVVATSDEPPTLRVRAGNVACAVAEYFRDHGRNVLLLMDSLTRLAMAQRQIGLAAGEPPATKGYPPSVFAMLPRLLERSGRTETGSITGFYSVLVEGDDINEPISDAVRGILDGHVWLERQLANRGHYPAIDVLASVSRVMIDVVSEQHVAQARRVQQLLATYRDIEDLVNIGAYQMGANPQYDLAIRSVGMINEFLQQGIYQTVSLEQAEAGLAELVGRIDRLAGEVEGGAAGVGRSAAPPARAQVMGR